MNKSGVEKDSVPKFIKNLPEKFHLPKDKIAKKLFAEYGALFAAANGAIPPETVIFKNDAAVEKWQKSVETAKETIGGFEIELQTAAMKHLKKAVAEAERENLTITPRGADSARRSYADTEQLWASRVNPALVHWTSEGKLTEAEAEKIRSLSPFEQISEIFKLEEKGMFCSKDLSKPIIYSVAPPGTSQHLSMLAFDVAEFGNADVRRILAKHRWFQTVISDLPHFTFLGIAETKLHDAGLKKIIDGERVFWIPNL